MEIPEEKCIVCGGDLLTNGYCADFTCRGYVIPGEAISCPQCKEKDKEIERLKKLLPPIGCDDPSRKYYMEDDE